MTKPAYHHGDLRRALIDAAHEELEAQGVEALSLRRVAKRAGVSHAAPAHHFVNAAGLLTALTAEGFRRFAAALKTAQEKAATRRQDPLTAAGAAYVEFALANPELFSLMFASAKPDFDDPELDAASMTAFQNFLQTVDSSASAKDRGGDVNIPAMQRWSTVHGLATLLLTGRMRSVLSLSAAKRKAAIVEILSEA